jgi:hypothetical protein
VTRLVSILVPAYNAQRWLDTALVSALEQTWPRKEVIVVDDGSTDRTLDVARRRACGNLRVLHQANRGAAAARNVALSAAQGDYIQWLDADDVLHPRKIEAQLARSSADDNAVLMTSAWGRFFASPRRADFRPNCLWRSLASKDWIIDKFRHNAFMVPASWIAGRKLVDRAGPWDERLSFDDDGEYFCRLVAAGRRVEFVPTASCCYRVGNNTSLSSQASTGAAESSLLSTRLCISHLLALEDSAATREAALAFVQENCRFFYPEHGDQFGQCESLARSLGGKLDVPANGPGFELFRRTFGWRRAKAVRAAMNRLRLLRDKHFEGLKSSTISGPERARTFVS